MRKALKKIRDEMMPTKTCSGILGHGGQCEKPAVRGEKYCSVCKANLISALKDEGYLKPVLDWRRRRGGEERENTYETKNGTDS